MSTKQTLGYALRFLVCLGTLEIILHYMYVVAIKDAQAWAGDTPAELCLLGFWNLIVVWLKVRQTSLPPCACCTHKPFSC